MVTGIDEYQIVRNFGELYCTFSAAQIFDSGYLGHFFRRVTKFGRVRGLANRHSVSEFAELWFTSPGRTLAYFFISRTFFCWSATKFCIFRGIGEYQILRGFCEFWSTFSEHKFSTADTSHTSCQRMTKFGIVRGLANYTYFPNFVNFGLRVPRYHAVTSISPSLMHLFFVFCFLLYWL